MHKAGRLTPTSYAILALLDRYGELSSYDIKSALEDSIQNFWPIPHTTAYEEPVRLAEAGYLSAVQEEGGRRRRRFALTDVGHNALRTWIEESAAASPQMRDELLLKVFAGTDPRLLIDERIEFCQARASKLRTSLEALRASEKDARGPILALGVAIRYNDDMVKLMHDLVADAD
jgi:PadR family transcriptional regulator AphA